MISTGNSDRVVIEGNPGLMSEVVIEQRLASLADLRIHPREKLENSVVLARGERLYEESLGDRRRYIGTLMQ